MKTIIGLGNPGKEYEHARHNAGFMLLDYLQATWQWSDWQTDKKTMVEACVNPGMCGPGARILDFTLAKPKAHMNCSGESVAAFLTFHNFSPDRNLIIAFDDLDLPLGIWKFQLARGPHGHNGLESVYSHLGTKDFYHLRIGIDGRGEDRTVPSRHYVLSKFSPAELEIISQVFIEIETRLKSL